ncbi:MAG: hypothetical protein MJ093_02195 [Saccharofermentans sp.]|nr:hypothetical protein [Saccharofermentans sp.]
MKTTIFDSVNLEINDNLKFFISEDDNTPTITNEDETFKVMFYHKKINPVLLAIGNKNAMRDRIAFDFAGENPTFRRGENYTIYVAGKKRLGLRYNYEIDGVKKFGESIIIIKGGDYYVVSSNYLESINEYGQDTFLEVLKGISI